MVTADSVQRRRTTIASAVCAVVAVPFLGGAVLSFDRAPEQGTPEVATAVTEIGTAAAGAGCGEITTEPATGAGRHVDGQRVDYAESPPAFGPHWSTSAGFDRTYYEAADRPQLERLVQLLEQGSTLIWYDAAVAADETQLQTIKDLAVAFAASDADRVIAVPWTSGDGDPFPGGAHVALSHWAIDGADARRRQGIGVWQFCKVPSGEAAADFVERYPANNSPEPDGA